jgi:hypothetical protein
MSTRIARFALQCSIGVAVAACNSDSGAIPCTMDDQCASHFCQADDTCAPLQNTPDGGMPDGGSGMMGSNGSNGVCTPNHDGMIVQSELPLAAGSHANFLIASGLGSGTDTWDTTGSAGSANSRTWDLTGVVGGSEQSIMLAAPAGAWWASDFPDATYASVLSESAPSLLGVFHVDSAGVTLLGVVSISGGPMETELKYDPPAKILALPVMAGSSWTSTSTVENIETGVPVAVYTEEYDSTVDQVGTMKTPYGTFPVLRVATNLLRNSVADSRTFAWVAECFGSVAQVTSQGFPNSVPSGEFSNPAEVWRITP